MEFYMETEAGKIHCCWWLPNGKPKGIVQLIHGVNEYAARYAPLAEFLTTHGFHVVAADHPGHGSSVGENDRFGYLTGGWMAAVKVVHQLHGMTAEQFPDLPYFMLGHSMGSFLLRTYLFTYHTDLAGALISGTGWMSPAILAAGRLLCREEAARLGWEQHSPTLQQIMFGPYNKQFAPNRTPYDWLSRDEAVVDAYAADPFCTWKPTVQLCYEMLGGLQLIQKKQNLARMQKKLPVFFFAGQQDPVGANGNGVLKAVQAFKDAGMEQVTVELYQEMRHECHNEVGKERVWHEILSWLDNLV